MDLTLRPKGEPDRCPWCHEHLGPEGGIEAEAVVDAPNAPAGAEPAVELEQPAGEAIGEPVSASTAPADAGAVTRCEGCGTAAHADCVAENGGCSIQGCSKQAPGKPRPKLSIQLEPRKAAPTRPARRRALRSVALASLLAGVAMSVGTALLAPQPLLEPRLHQRATSPDGGHEVLLWKRVAWPPLGGDDPWLLVHVDLLESGTLVGRSEVRVRASRLAGATIRWDEHRVDVIVAPGAYVWFPVHGPAIAADPPPPTTSPPREPTPVWVSPPHRVTSTGLTVRQRADGSWEVHLGGEWVPYRPADHGSF